MYKQHFGIAEKPFSLTPDPRFLYMSRVHEEALAHLLYGVSEGGGFVLLTGEVGTGKTAMCRCLLNQLPENVDLALILNPRITEAELVASICEELEVDFPADTDSLKVLTDALGAYLREAHARGRNTVVMIDEAQNLAPALLEQLRLLTNLETEKQKLLQIILVGQPELNDILARPDMRQLYQRITARFHLQPLGLDDTRAYIRHRLAVAGLTAPVFNAQAADAVHKASGGIPRLINSICDRCLLAAYADGRRDVDRRMVKAAAMEVLGVPRRRPRRKVLPVAAATGVAAGLAFLLLGPIDLDPAVTSVRDFTQAWLDDVPGERPAAGPPDAVAAQAEIAAPSPPEPPGASAAPSPQDSPVNVEPALSEFAAALHAAKTMSAAATSVSAGPRATVAALGDVAKRIAETIDQAPAQGRDGEAPSAAPAAIETVALVAPEAPRAPPPAAPAVIDLEELFRQAGGDREQALAALFGVWSLDYAGLAGTDPCEKARSAGLDCLEEKGPWRWLEILDRPALVALYNAAGKEVHAVVTAVDGERVVLDVAGRKVAADRKRLIYYWSGNYFILWRPPEAYRRVLRVGHSGTDVAWLRTQLAEHLQRPAGSGATTFDSELEELVMAFQRSRYLKEDGVVGARTVIHMNSVSGDPTVPRLKQP